MPSPEDRSARSDVLPMLEDMAIQCWQHQIPLLPIIGCHWIDGSVDLPTARWLWLLRYGDSERLLPADDKEALAMVKEEIATVHEWVINREGGKS